MRVNDLGVEALLRHQRGGAVRRAPALAADAVNVDVVAHEIGQIDRHLFAGERGETDAAAAIDHPRRLVESVRRARAFQHVLDALASGQPGDSRDGILVAHIDDRVRPEFAAHFQPAVARAGQNNRRGAERLGDRNPHQSDRSRAGHDDALAGDQPAHDVEPVHRGAGRDDQRRFRVRHVVRDMDHRVDIVDGIFGKAAIGREAVRAVSFRREAVVEARGIHALAAARAAAAPGMDLDRDPVADLEFVHRRTKLDDRAHVFVADRKILVERQFAFDHRRQAVPQYFDVCRADRDRVDTDQHLRRAGLRHRLFDQRQFLGAAEHPCLHRARHRIFIPALRCCRQCSSMSS